MVAKAEFAASFVREREFHSTGFTDAGAGFLEASVGSQRGSTGLPGTTGSRRGTSWHTMDDLSKVQLVDERDSTSAKSGCAEGLI